MAQKQIAIVGAGVGGLVCANLVAKEYPDKKVILIEKQKQVGGLAQTWKRKIKIDKNQELRVIYELTHAIPEMHEGGRFRKLYQELGADFDNIGKFEPAPKFAQYITLDPHDEKLVILNTLEETLGELSKKFPNEHEGIERFKKFLEKMDRERLSASSFKKNLEEKVAPFIQDHFPQPLKFLSQAALFGYTKPTFVMNRNNTFQNILDKYFQEADIKTTLSMLYGYVGLPPSRVSGNLFTLMLLSYWRGGGPQAPAEKSYQAMHDELARVLVEKHNGEIRLNSEVMEIYADDGKISGLRINPVGRHHQEYSLDAECVVVAGDPQTTLLPLLRKYLPKRYVEQIEDYEMSISLMATHVLTDLPLHEMKDRLGYAANILASSKEVIEKENENNFPEEFMIYVNAPTVLRPDAGLVIDKDGNKIKDVHIVDMVMRSRPYEKCKRLRRDDKMRAYRMFKEEHMDKMIEITENLLIPNLSGHVLHREMYTAATYDRYGNPAGGAVYSIAPTIDGFVPNRPSPTIPIKGAFLTGSAILAGGVGGAITGAEVTAKEVNEYLKNQKPCRK